MNEVCGRCDGRERRKYHNGVAKDDDDVNTNDDGRMAHLFVRAGRAREFSHEGE
jgi:hypothetical protein